MGTSTSSRGANNRSPLVPPWADVDGAGTGPEPETNRFKGFRTSLGRFVQSGDRAHLSKAVQQYARSSTGGSAVGPRRFGAMAQAGAGLFDVLNQFRQDVARLPIDLRALQGRPTREVIEAIVDALVPENGDADRVRAAINEALASCLEGQQQYDFTEMSDELLIDVMVAYASLCVFEQIMQDSDRAFTKAETMEQADRAERTILELVKAVTDKHMRPLLDGHIATMTQDAMQQAQLAAIKEVWCEWEGDQS